MYKFRTEKSVLGHNPPGQKTRKKVPGHPRAKKQANSPPPRKKKKCVRSNVYLWERETVISTYTSTLWNTTECFHGFEDMKDEIGSSLKASVIFGLIFYWMYYFWVENLSDLCKLIVCGSQTRRSNQQTQKFPKHGPTQPCIHSWEFRR